MDRKLNAEYRKREIRWAEKSLEQFGYFNNLILTFAVGFFTFAYKNNYFKGLHFTITNINWHVTSMVLSMISVALSIIIGLKVAIGRLYDFRFTRKINQIRHRMLQHANT